MHSLDDKAHSLDNKVHSLEKELATEKTHSTALQNQIDSIKDLERNMTQKEVAVSKAKSSPSPHKILLVDDDADLLQLLALRPLCRRLCGRDRG